MHFSFPVRCAKLRRPMKRFSPPGWKPPLLFTLLILIATTATTAQPAPRTQPPAQPAPRTQAVPPAPAAPPAATSRPTTTSNRITVTTPPGFVRVDANGRSVLCEPAEQQWVREVISTLG